MTNHMSRIRNSTARHNDRDHIDAAHIHKEKTANNRYWNMYENTYSDRNREKHMTFAEVEKKAYSELFGEHIKDINSRAEKSRHTERKISVKKMLSNPRTMPQETIFQIGSMKNRAIENVSDIWNIWNAFISWHKKTYPQICILDYALHTDEAYYHIHMRQCYTYMDDNKIMREGQEKALEQMGIPLPNPEEKRGRYNNRKMTYTKEVSAKLKEICKEFGYEIEEKPLKQKHNLKKEEAILQEIKKESKELQQKMKYMKEFEETYKQIRNELDEEIERERGKNKNRER